MIYFSNLSLNFPNFQKFETEKTCPKGVLFCFSSVWLLSVSKVFDNEIRKTPWCWTVRNSLIYKTGLDKFNSWHSILGTCPTGHAKHESAKPKSTTWNYCFLFFITLIGLGALIFDDLPLKVFAIMFLSFQVAIWILFGCLKWDALQRKIFILQKHQSEGIQENMLRV